MASLFHGEDAVGGALLETQAVRLDSPRKRVKAPALLRQIEGVALLLPIQGAGDDCLSARGRRTEFLFAKKTTEDCRL